MTIPLINILEFTNTEKKTLNCFLTTQYSGLYESHLLLWNFYKSSQQEMTFSRNIKKRTADPKPQDDDPTKPGRFQVRPVRPAFGSQFSSQLQPSFRQFLSGRGIIVPVGAQNQ